MTQRLPRTKGHAHTSHTHTHTHMQTHTQCQDAKTTLRKLKTRETNSASMVITHTLFFTSSSLSREDEGQGDRDTKPHSPHPFLAAMDCQHNLNGTQFWAGLVDRRAGQMSLESLSSLRGLLVCALKLGQCRLGLDRACKCSKLHLRVWGPGGSAGRWGVKGEQPSQRHRPRASCCDGLLLEAHLGRTVTSHWD